VLNLIGGKAGVLSMGGWNPVTSEPVWSRLKSRSEREKKHFTLEDARRNRKSKGV